MQMGPRAPPNGQSATSWDGDGTSCLVLRYGSEHASGRGFSFPPQVPCISTTDGWLGNVRLEPLVPMHSWVGALRVRLAWVNT